MSELTREQHEAIEAYAYRYGPDWKQRLADDWITGRDVNALKHDGIDGCYLRQIRNQFGPSWLAEFELESGPKVRTDKELNRKLPGTLLAAFSFPAFACQAPGRIVLVNRGGEYQPFVVWWQNRTDGGCSHGGYHDSHSAAAVEFLRRARREIATIEGAEGVQEASGK